MCLFVSLLLLGPRTTIVLHWLVWPERWERAFDTFFLPFAGFFLAPWTTLAYVVVAPGGVEGFDVVVLLLGFVADLASLAASGGYNRRRAMSPSY